MRLDFRDASPIYQQIIDAISREITQGVLRQGEQLPSVRELAAQLSINPNTISRSYRKLEMDGWIVTVPGKGCFVLGVPKDAREEGKKWMADFIRLGKKLLALGYTPEELTKRLEQEDRNA